MNQNNKPLPTHPSQATSAKDYQPWKRLITSFRRVSHRSQNLSKNILGIGIIKACSIACSYLSIPLILNYIGSSKYGIWITLGSIVTWFNILDIGMTHGMKNHIATAKAHNDTGGIAEYLSTTYAALIVIFGTLLLSYVAIHRFIPWQIILNTELASSSDLDTLALIIVSAFCVQNAIKPFSTLLTALQAPSKAALIDLLGQISSLFGLFILTYSNHRSLPLLGAMICFPPIIITIIASIASFKSDSMQGIAPKVSLIRIDRAKSTLKLGGKFFAIQVAGIIQFQLASLIIIRNFGPSDVSSFNIIQKLFSAMPLIFSIFLAPFWSAATEAFAKNDTNWIKSWIRNYSIVGFFIIASGFLALIFSSNIYHIWLGDKIPSISSTASIFGFVFYSLSVFGSPYVSFLNGISATKVQFFACLVSPIIYLSAAYFCINQLHLGIASLFIASIVANFNGYIIAPIQYSKIIRNQGAKIWRE